MKEYVVIFERGQDGEENWGAYVPDLPGCTTTADSFDEAKQNIRQAIESHIAVLKQLGRAIPEPSSEAQRIVVAA